MDNPLPFFDSQLMQEDLTGAEFSGEHSDEKITPETTFFEEILATVNTTILSMEEENTCLERNEANTSDLKRTTLTPIILQYPTDRDKVVEPNCCITNSSLLEEIYENSVRDLEISKSISEKMCELQDSCSPKDLAAKQQCTSFESLRLNSPVESAIQDINIFANSAEVHSMPELSNAIHVASLKDQKMESGSCHENLNLADVSHVEDTVLKDSFHNLATHCDMNREPDNAFEHINSCNFSLDAGDETRLRSEMELIPTIKNCQVVLKRCDSLVEEYFTNCPVRNPSFLQADQISEVSNPERVLEKNVSKNFKSKRCKKKKAKKTLIGNDCNNVVEPCPGTPTTCIKTIDTQDMCPDNDSLLSNVFNTKVNPLSEDIGKPIRRKRNTSSVISENYSISIKTCKKLKCSDGTNSENSETLQNKSNSRFHKSHNLFESADSDVDSDYSSSKDNFKASKCKNTKNIKDISSSQCEQTLEGIEKSVINLENNYSGGSVDLSVLSNDSQFESLSNQQARQCDFSSLIRPCRVVLTRMEYNSDFSPFSTTSLRGSCIFDLSESSDLESEVDLLKPKLRRNELNRQPYYEDLIIPEYSCDTEVSTVERISDSISFSSVKCGDSESQFIESVNSGSARNRVSGFSASRSTVTEDVLPDTSAAEEIPSPSDLSQPPRKSQKSKKCKKSQRVKESAPDLSRSKKSGVHRELLELYKNEFTQELKDLKAIMKRTERKLDALIKIHEQVIDFYE